MLIKEVTEPAQTEPDPQEIKDVEQLIGTIDLQQEQPQTLLNKLTGWMREHPLLDRITDLIPQTRLVKAIAGAVDAIEAGNQQGALNALAGIVGGNLAQAARAVNVSTALQQGDLRQAAQAAGGPAAKVARVATTAQQLAQGGLAQALNPREDLDRIRELAQTANRQKI